MFRHVTSIWLHLSDIGCVAMTLSHHVTIFVINYAITPSQPRLTANRALCGKQLPPAGRQPEGLND